MLIRLIKVLLEKVSAIVGKLEINLQVRIVQIIEDLEGASYA